MSFIVYVSQLPTRVAEAQKYFRSSGMDTGKMILLGTLVVIVIMVAVDMFINARKK
jgi:hypothetical protein